MVICSGLKLEKARLTVWAVGTESTEILEARSWKAFAIELNWI